MATTIQQVGDRYYLKDLPFDEKDKAKAAGCRWDPTARKWWTSDLTAAESVAGAKLDTNAASVKPGKQADLTSVRDWGTARERVTEALPELVAAEWRSLERWSKASANLSTVSRLLMELQSAEAGTELAVVQGYLEKLREKEREAEEKARAARRACEEAL